MVDWGKTIAARVNRIKVSDLNKGDECAHRRRLDKKFMRALLFDFYDENTVENILLKDRGQANGFFETCIALMGRKGGRTRTAGCINIEDVTGEVIDKLEYNLNLKIGEN